MIEAGLTEGVVGRGVERGLVDVRVHDLRAFTTDRHRTVDDVPYGGGPGMVMKVEPFVRALRGDPVRARRAGGGGAALAAGAPVRPGARRGGLPGWDTWCCSAAATRGSTSGCGSWSPPRSCRLATSCVSGGELPALLVIDAVSRLVPGVVGDGDSVEQDSFSHGLLDYPHYTRPAEFEGRPGARRAAFGASRRGARWRRKAAMRRTLDRRPDLWDAAALDDEDRDLAGEAVERRDDARARPAIAER